MKKYIGKIVQQEDKSVYCRVEQLWYFLLFLYLFNDECVVLTGNLNE